MLEKKYKIKYCFYVFTYDGQKEIEFRQLNNLTLEEVKINYHDLKRMNLKNQIFDIQLFEIVEKLVTIEEVMQDVK